MPERHHCQTHNLLYDGTDCPRCDDFLFQEAKRLNSWLGGVMECDPDEIVADGGITAGMVIIQEAREMQRRLRAAIQSEIERRNIR